MVCLLVVEHSWPPAGAACVEVVHLLTVLVVVWRLKVAETVDLAVTVLSCEADFKEVWDVDFFILGGGCNDKGIYYKNANKQQVTWPPPVKKQTNNKIKTKPIVRHTLWVSCNYSWGTSPKIILTRPQNISYFFLSIISSWQLGQQRIEFRCPTAKTTSPMQMRCHTSASITIFHEGGKIAWQAQRPSA